MNILVLTSLWPNSEQPRLGLFIKHRITALARLGAVSLRVVAPVPYFPKRLQWPLIPDHWRRMARVSPREVTEGLEVYHPRYLLLPKLGMRFHGRWMARGAADLVRRHLSERPLDLIDAHYVYPDGFAAVQLGRALGVPVVVTARGSDINLFSQMPRIRLLLCSTLDQAAGVIAVSASLKQRIVELGIAPEKVAVIRNGVDRGLFYPREAAVARRKLGLEPHAPVLVTVSSLTPNKGIDRLIDALALLARQRADLSPRLYVIGEGPERDGLQARIARQALAGRVRLIGSREPSELAEWYSAADLFCLASQREGCPNVVIEALACGVPVIATDVGGIGELVTGAAYGRLVPAHQEVVEGLAAAIGEALETCWDRAGIAAHGGARSWDEVAAEIMGYYDQLGIIKHGRQGAGAQGR
jgi:glycosyltransferase involved in cell wall biosynthesis